MALLGDLDPNDLEYANQIQASAILNEISPDQPDHPGISHYLIHANDYPALTELGLEPKLKYADIAPSSGHALHMPSHTYTLLGMWSEEIGKLQPTFGRQTV